MEEDLPVSAETSKPNLDISITPIDPTPPVAPETNTGKFDSPEDFCIFNTLAAAVKPAVPRDMASIAVRLIGFLTTQLAGTLMYSPKPPGVFMPMSYPVTMTSSPSSNCEEFPSVIIPAASIPGTNG